MKVILILSLLAPNLLLGQGTPDTGNPKLWEMRKKMQQRSAQRTGSYVEQMNQALQSGDAEGAESALKAAIAQGTLTQTQINDARGRIDSMVSLQRQAMVAEARAKQEAEAAASQRMTPPASTNSPSISAPTREGRSVMLNFIGSGIQSIRVFNVNSSGQEVRYPVEGSPANCSLAKDSESRDQTTPYFSVNVMNDGKGLAGTYGYEATFAQITERNLISPNQVGARKGFKGVFRIPAGATMGRLTFEKFNWIDDHADLRSVFD